MAKVTLIALPYDTGRPNERMGRGPLHLLENGLPDHLRARERDVDVVTIRLPESFYFDGAALVQLQNLAVAAIREGLAGDRRILVLSGNCGPAALSATAALGPRRTGVVWFDAHADFNTPEISPSGFLDGMSLALLTGRCWPGLAARFAGFEPVPDANVILVGARDLDSLEADALNQSAITHIAPANLDALEGAVKALAQRVENFYVHLDVDVLDRSEGCANSYASGGGLSAQQLFSALELLARSGRIKIAGITSYDPACDGSGNIRAIIQNAATILASG
jgi:arginase